MKAISLPSGYIAISASLAAHVAMIRQYSADVARFIAVLPHVDIENSLEEIERLSAQQGWSVQDYIDVTREAGELGIACADFVRGRIELAEDVAEPLLFVQCGHA